MSDVLDQALQRLQSIMASHDYTILTDAGHENGSILCGFLTSGDFMQIMKAAGVTSIAIEQPRDYQHHADFSVEKARDVGKQNVIGAIDKINKEYVASGKKISQAYQYFGDYIKLAILLDPEIKIIFADEASESNIGKPWLQRSISRLWKNLFAENLREKVYRRGGVSCNAEVLQHVDLFAPEGRRLVVFGSAHAPAMKKILVSRGHSVAVIALHANEAAYNASCRIADQYSSILRYNKFLAELAESPWKDHPNFLIEERRFIDEPAPSHLFRPTPKSQAAQIVMK